MLGRLASIWPTLLVVLIVVAFIVALVLLVLKALRAHNTREREKAALRQQDEAAKKVEDEAAQGPRPPEAQPISFSRLKRGFSRATRLLRESLAGRDLYDVPQFLLIGERGAGKTTTLGACGLDRPLSGYESLGPGTGGCGFWFFDRAVVLEVGGQLLEGGAASERTWEKLLRLIERFRPRRPIDGVLIAVPCDALVGPTALSSGVLASRGEELYQRLVQVQRVLGMSFPVYVLLTKTDLVRGFGYFCAALPPRLGAEPLGWSSPYAISSAFAADWIDGGFDAVVEGIQHTQLELLAETRGGPRDSFFLFPARFEALHQPLRTLLSAAFRETAYHSPFHFRGFYFCGDPDPRSGSRGPAAAGEPREPAPGPLPGAALAAEAEPQRKVYFVKNLLAEKVFLERGLARPAAAASRGYSRIRLACQLAIVLVALVGGFGLWRSLDRLEEQSRALMPALVHTREDLAVVDAGESSPLEPPSESSDLLQQRARELLQDMSRIPTTSVRYLFIPSSWLSPLSADIRQAMAGAFDQVVFHGIRANLDGRSWDLYEREPAADRSDDAATIEQTPEFRSFAGLVEGTAALEKHARLYNGLRGAAGAADLPAVVRYTFDTELPQDFSVSDFYEATLHKTRHTLADTGAYRTAAIRRFPLLTSALAERMYGQSPVMRRLLRLRDQFQAIAEGRAAERHPADVLSDLLDSIRAAEEALATGEGAWIAEDRPTLTRPLRQLLVTIGNSTYLGPGAKADAQREFERAFHDAKPKLASLQTQITGMLLVEKDGHLQPQLATVVVALKENLAQLLERAFMRRQTLVSGDRVEPAGFRLSWDVGSLDRAVQLADPYKAFVAEGLAKFPPELQQALSTLAAERVQLGMTGLIDKAVHGEGPRGAEGVAMEASLRDEVAGLKQAERSLTSLLDNAYALGLHRTFERLAYVVGTQGQEMLAAIDQILEGGRPYGVSGRDFSWWDGAGSPGMRAFDAPDPGALKDYLDVQRELIRHLAHDYAEPVIRLLNATRPAPDALGPRYAKWWRILNALDGYEKMQPGNSVAALEQFVTKDLVEIRLDTCLERLKEGAIGGGDLFVEKRDDLRRTLRERCAYLAAVESRRAYGEIERQFNRDLAGKFPFAPDAEKGQATLAAIRDFYRLVDAYMALYYPVLQKNVRFGLSRERALQFLERARDARPVFAGFLDAKAKDAVPMFDVNVEFRVNRDSEVGAENVIDWMLAVGNQRLGWRDKPVKLRWVYGEPVSLALRWAKDAPISPGAAVSGGRVNLAERRVDFEGKGAFSLLELIARHTPEPSDFRRGRDEDPQTLVFAIPTRRVDRPAGSATAEEVAKVFLRLQLRPPDGPDPILVPLFPESAPPLPPIEGEERTLTEAK